MEQMPARRCALTTTRRTNARHVLLLLAHPANFFGVCAVSAGSFLAAGAQTTILSVLAVEIVVARFVPRTQWFKRWALARSASRRRDAVRAQIEQKKNRMTAAHKSEIEQLQRHVDDVYAFAAQQGVDPAVPAALQLEDLLAHYAEAAVCVQSLLEVTCDDVRSISPDGTPAGSSRESIIKARIAQRRESNDRMMSLLGELEVAREAVLLARERMRGAASCSLEADLEVLANYVDDVSREIIPSRRAVREA